MEQVTEADKKWLAQLLDNDSVDIGINEDGEPYINFSDDYETIKRAKSICGSNHTNLRVEKKLYRDCHHQIKLITRPANIISYNYLIILFITGLA